MRFMIHFVYPNGFPEAAAALLPEEAERVQALTRAGVTDAFSWAADRSRGWLVSRNESRQEAVRLLDGMALRPFWELAIVPL